MTIRYLGTIVKIIVLLKGAGAKLIEIPNYKYSIDKSDSESILIIPLIPTWLRSIPNVGL